MVKTDVYFQHAGSQRTGCPPGYLEQRLSLATATDSSNDCVFQNATVKAALELMGLSAVGRDRERLHWHIYRRTGMSKIQPLRDIYPCLKPGALLQEPVPGFYQKVWNRASSENF